jgi:hypothetical protein
MFSPHIRFCDSAIAEHGLGPLGCNMGRLCTDHDRQSLAKDVGSCGTLTRLFDELYLQKHNEQPRNLTCFMEPV